MSEAAWQLVSRLGELQIMLPALLAAAWAIRTRSPRLAHCWLAASLAAVVLTAASKVAFIGYGLGLAAIDFTGVSGHAMIASAVLPVLLLLAAGIVAERARAVGLALGALLAAAVACSRVQLGAHSWSEVAAGVILGCAVTVFTLQSGPVPVLRLPRALVIALFAALLLAMTQMPESRTHDAVTRLALSLSGRPHPYTRWQMHRRPLRGGVSGWRREADPFAAAPKPVRAPDLGPLGAVQPAGNKPKPRRAATQERRSPLGAGFANACQH